MKVNNTRMGILQTAIFEALGDRTIEINGNFTTSDNRVKFGVNWAALGTVSPGKTKEYAERLVQAADIAERFNSMSMEIVYQDDRFIDTGERCISAKIRVKKLLEDGNYEAIEGFMKGGF